MTNLSTDARQALKLYRSLLERGLDPDFAELQVEKRGGELEDRSAEGLAGEIVQEAPEKWKGEAASSAGEPGPGSGEESGSPGGGGGNYYDRLRERIEAEREEKRQRSRSRRQKLDRGGL